MGSQSPVVGLFARAIRARWSSHGPGHLRDSLAAAIREAIEAGRLPAAGRLPPERALAQELGVSRTTVVAAYGTLVDSGLLFRRTGSGTFVAAARVGGAGAASRLSDNPLLDHPDPGPEELIDLRTGALEADESVIPALRDTLPQLARLARQHGYVTQGWLPLRAAIAEHLSAGGLDSDPDQILITSGAQQAIDLAVQALADPGDSVLVESPTYPGALDVLRRANVSAIPVPIGIDGVRSDRARAAAARAGPRLLYLTPTFNNPIGAVVPAAERRRLAELADELGFIVVEDLSLAELSLTGTPPPPIGAFSRAGRVLSIGSFSKLYWGGLRLGWVRGPASLVGRLTRIKSVVDAGSALALQVAGAELLTRAGEVMRRRQEQLRSRHEVLDGVLRAAFPSWRWTTPKGGLTIWARLPFADAERLAGLARGHGVDVVSGMHFSVDGSTDSYLRLPYTRPPRVLEEGVRRLAAAWREFEAAPAATAPLV